MELTKSAHTQRNEFRKCKTDACTGTEREKTMTKAMTNQYKAQVFGLLMIPKTCAYIWMIVMGLQLLF